MERIRVAVEGVLLGSNTTRTFTQVALPFAPQPISLAGAQLGVVLPANNSDSHFVLFKTCGLACALVCCSNCITASPLHPSHRTGRYQPLLPLLEKSASLIDKHHCWCVRARVEPLRRPRCNPCFRWLKPLQ